MTSNVLQRRQRWAAFSVRAHRDLGSLAADVLLYDRIILPVPENDPERERGSVSSGIPTTSPPESFNPLGI